MVGALGNSAMILPGSVFHKPNLSSGEDRETRDVATRHETETCQVQETETTGSRVLGSWDP